MSKILPVLASVAFLGAAAAARADVATACAPDVKSYCSGIDRGVGLKDCMAENRAKLSDKCKLAVADRELEKDAKEAASRKGGKGMAPK